MRTWRKYQGCLFVFFCSTSIFKRICRSSKQDDVGKYLPSNGVLHEYLLETHLKLIFIEEIILCSNAPICMQMYHLYNKNRILWCISWFFQCWEALCEWNLRNGEIWKELDQTKNLRPTGTFSDYLFRSYSSLKMTCLKVKSVFFVIFDFWYLHLNWPPFLNGLR